MVERRIGPQPGPQTKFLTTRADIAIFGGGAGGGKSYALLMEPLRHIYNAGFGAVIFRRTYPRITNEGSLWDEAATLYPLLGGKANQADLIYRFPSGARVGFAHLQYETTVQQYHGSQIALIAFDELTEFTERQFWYMFSRNRSGCGVRPYVRCTCNPDAESWVARLLAWWIDEKTGYAIPGRSGKLRWFVRSVDELKWADSPAELRERYGRQMQPKSLTFIPATVYDNPMLMARNPEYLGNLMALNLIDEERLLKGNWKIKPAAGKIFNRGWFEIVERAPAAGKDCRFFDFAATAKGQRGSDPDFTAGVLMRKVGGQVYVINCIADQVGPADGDILFVNTVLQDALAAREAKREYLIRWEEEGGSSGKKESRRLVGLLVAKLSEHGLTVDAAGIHPVGDKLTRAKSLASSAKVGDVKLQAGAWNEMWLGHMHGQPDLPHDDIMDASAGAYNAFETETSGIAMPDDEPALIGEPAVEELSTRRTMQRTDPELLAELDGSQAPMARLDPVDFGAAVLDDV